METKLTAVAGIRELRNLSIISSDASILTKYLHVSV